MSADDDYDTNTTSTSALYYNLAFGKPTSQSSNLGNDLSNSANAVDGRFDHTGDIIKDQSKVTMTEVEKDPWWEVNLGGMFSISKIILYFNSDESTDSSDLSISLYNDFNEVMMYRKFFSNEDSETNQPMITLIFR